MKKTRIKTGDTRGGVGTLLFTMTEDEYHQLCDDDTGLCIECGAERDSCEPDARNYPCPSCLAGGVFGIEELLAMERIELK